MTDYKRCRVCLVHASDAVLSSLHGNDGGKAVLFEKLFGIDLTNDNKEALICDKCSTKVSKVHAFIDNARHLDETYFAAARFISSCSSDDDMPRVCRCCQSASHLCRITETSPDLAHLLLLITGINVHDDEKAWICSKCRKTLRRADSLDFFINENQKLHFNNKTDPEVTAKKNSPKATKSKPLAAKIQCADCLKSYSNASNLKLHVQNVHEKKTRFDCNFCEFQTLFITNFLRHIATHLDIAVGKTKLNQFDAKKESAVHLNCQVCSEDFESLASLKQHFMQKHQASRKFECDYCGWRSVFKKDVGNHITCKHLIMSLHDMYDKERRFKCTFKDCHKRFKIQTLLRQHITRTHSGIRYPCWWCQKSYCRKILLKKHQLTCLQPLAPIKTEPR